MTIIYLSIIHLFPRTPLSNPVILLYKPLMEKESHQLFPGVIMDLFSGPSLLPHKVYRRTAQNSAYWKYFPLGISGWHKCGHSVAAICFWMGSTSIKKTGNFFLLGFLANSHG